MQTWWRRENEMRIKQEVSWKERGLVKESLNKPNEKGRKKREWAKWERENLKTVVSAGEFHLDSFSSSLQMKRGWQWKFFVAILRISRDSFPPSSSSQFLSSLLSFLSFVHLLLLFSPIEKSRYIQHTLRILCLHPIFLSLYSILSFVFFLLLFFPIQKCKCIQEKNRKTCWGRKREAAKGQ